MFQDEDLKVEQPALEQLKSLGWDYTHGSELSPESSDEREFFSDVILQSRLTNAVKKLNPWINDDNLRKVIREISHPLVPTLIEANETIWQTLVQYQSVEQDLGKGRKGQTVKIIDFEHPENNDFLCVNQFKIQGTHQNIIPDIILFVNGLPLAVIECKSPYITNPMESGIDQLLRYANRRQPHEDEGAEKLFWYNQMMVSTHRESARVGTISSKIEHYLEWKDPYPLTHNQVFLQSVEDNSDVVLLDKNDAKNHVNSQEVLIAGLFNKQNFLDIIQNFTVFEPVDGRVIKKIARYQQFRAVHKTIERLKSGNNRKDKGGVIWHTQGSGKSLTMVFLSVKLRRDPELKEYKLVFLTDRTQLDQQLTATFNRTQGETVLHANSVKHLKELLAKDSSDLVTGMIQKFREDELGFDEAINESDKIIVLADEAHRSQYGNLGVLINAWLPNAPKIAFTGTPLIKSQKTNNEFGSYIDTYTIEQAVNDGATVQIVYEGREVQTKITGDSLDQLFDEYFAGRTIEEQNAIKNTYGTARAVIEAPQRIRWVCIDILKHYRDHIQPNGFKAMIVTSSRRAAVIYKETLDELGAPESACIISGSHNDDAMFTKYTDSTKQKIEIENFKKPITEVGPSILIVKDMLLTGFDAPICQVMYLDRPLSEHNLLQAIARVNRTNSGKQRGFVVDYYGISDYLTEALQMFSEEDVADAMTELKDEIPKLQVAYMKCMEHFKDMEIDDTDACIISLEKAEKRQMFEIDFKGFAKQMDIVMPDAAARPFIQDLLLLGRINLGARNLFRDPQLDLTGVGEKVRKLIDEHVRATGIDPKIPPVNLFDESFIKRLDEHVDDVRSKAYEIEYAILAHIDDNLEEDPEFYQSLSEQLKDLIESNKEHWEELVQQLLDFRSDIETTHHKKATGKGLTDTEYAFYNILTAEIERIHDIDELDDDQDAEILDITRTLVEILDSATAIVDFFNKPTEIKSVQRDIKHSIVDSTFDNAELRRAIMDRFMELARVKFNR